MEISLNPGVWIAALLTLMIYSFLYKDNPFYKFAEHLLVGVSAGYVFTILFWNYIKPNVWGKLVNPDIPTLVRVLTVVSVLFGILMLTRFLKKFSWLSRYPMALLMGISSGAAIPPTMQTRIIDQMHASMNMLEFNRVHTYTHELPIVIGMLATLIYFFFSKPHKGVLGGGAKVGIIFLMVGFGASFGYTVMARISLLIGRCYFLLHDWLGIIT